MKMKGSMEGVLPMMGVLILAFAMGIQSIPISEAFADLMEDSTEELGNTIDARAYAEFYFYNYVPLGTEYAFNNASYNLGPKAGGLEWNDSSLSKDGEVKPWTLRIKWRRNATTIVNNWVEESEGECEIPAQGLPEPFFNIIIETPLYSNHTNFQLVAGDQSGYSGVRVSVNCPGTSTQYIGPEYSAPDRKALDNRYYRLANESFHLMNATRTNLSEKVDGWPRSDTGRACGDAHEAGEEAERSMMNTLDNQVRNAITTASEPFPKEDFIEQAYDPIEKAEVSSDNWEYVESQKIVRRAGETDIETGSCCEWDCDKGGCTCVANTKHAHATAAPAKVNIPWHINDSERKVIVDDKYRTLNFTLEGRDEYTHIWNLNPPYPNAEPDGSLSIDRPDLDNLEIEDGETVTIS